MTPTRGASISSVTKRESRVQEPKGRGEWVAGPAALPGLRDGRPAILTLAISLPTARSVCTKPMENAQASPWWSEIRRLDRS